MRDAVIVSAVRTAVGRAPRGALRETRADDLAATAIREALARVPSLDPADVEDVVLGCAMPEGEQGLNAARPVALAAGLPVGVSAMVVNRFCASGLQALAIAAGRVVGFSPLLLLYAGRLGNLFFWLACGWACLRILPVYRWVFVLLLLMPMPLILAASLSADTFHTATCFLLVAVCLRWGLAEEGRLAWWKVGALVLLTGLLSWSKSGYQPLLLLLLIISLVASKLI